MKCLILSIFFKKYKLIIKPLLSGKTLNYTKKNYDILLVWRLFKRLLFSKSKRNDKINKNNFKKNTVATFFSNHLERNNRFKYFNGLQKVVKPDYYIARNSLYIDNILTRAHVFVVIFILTNIIFFFAIIFKKNRVQLSFLPVCIFEWFCLLNCLSKIKCSYLYHWDAYEIDSNFIAYLNSSEGIKNHKIISSGPLETYYHDMYCDTISLTSRNNKIDTQKYNWHVGNILHWPPTYYHDYVKHVNKGYKYKYKLGLISSASWLRVKNGDTSTPEFFDSENELNNFLKHYIRDKSDNKLLILLHPWEKITSEVYNESISYYKNLYESDNIFFGDKNINSLEYFKNINTSISTFSSLCMGRLFCGYKTIYAPIKYKKRFDQDINLNSIFAYNKNQLDDLLTKIIKMSDNQFFNYYRLNEYTHKNYNTIKK